MRRIARFLFGLVLLAGCMPAMATGHVHRDMVDLDRAYIPALVTTSQGDLEQSRKALLVLRRRWNDFRFVWLAGYPEHPVWKEGLEQVETQLANAESLAAKPASLPKAHEELEVIRYIFLRLRSELGLDYFLDHLTRFHASMENILLSAKKRRPETLREKEVKVIHEYWSQARELWLAVMEAEFDVQRYRLGEEKRWRLNRLRLLEAERLMALQAALEQQDKPAVYQASLALKPPFAELFMMFGDFSGLKIPTR